MITKEQWAEIEKKLQSHYGGVDLLCDGYALSLRVHRDKMRLVIVPFINGEIKGIWFKECEERRRFFRPVQRKRWIASTWKGFTKKELKSMKVDLNETWTHYQPFWLSFRPLKAHLIKHNTSIELVPEG